MQSEEFHKYTCPVCGYLVFDKLPGSYDNCPVCGWEDDNSQLHWPYIGGGANHESLFEAQQKFLSQSLPVTAKDYLRDPDWKPLDEDIRKVFEANEGSIKKGVWPSDDTQLYWWRDNFWLKNQE